MKKKVSSEATFLATLADVNRALAAARSPRAGLQRGLQILGHLYGVSRTSVVLKNPDTDRLEIEASEGLTAAGRPDRSSSSGTSNQSRTNISASDRSTAQAQNVRNLLHLYTHRWTTKTGRRNERGLTFC